MDAVGGLPGQARSIASEAVLGLGKTSLDAGARHAAGDGLSQGKCTCWLLESIWEFRAPKCLVRDAHLPLPHFYSVPSQLHS